MSDFIQSDIENIDAVVRSFAVNIEDFAAVITSKMGEIDSSMARLSQAWEGRLYDEFTDNMRNKQSQIRQTVANANRLKEKLEGVAAEMSMLLEIMGQAGADDL